MSDVDRESGVTHTTRVQGEGTMMKTEPDISGWSAEDALPTWGDLDVTIRGRAEGVATALTALRYYMRNRQDPEYLVEAEAILEAVLAGEWDRYGISHFEQDGEQLTDALGRSG